MPTPELVEAQEIRLKLAHVIAGHIGKPFDELKATEVERNQSYDYGESQETVLDIVDEVLKAHEEWLESQGLVVVPREPTVEMLGACMTKPLGAVTAVTKDDMELLARDWQAMISTALAEE